MELYAYMENFADKAMTLTEYKTAILLTTNMTELNALAKRAYLQDDHALSKTPTLYNEVVTLCHRRADELGTGNRLVGKRAVVTEDGKSRYGTIVAALTKMETKSCGMYGQSASIYMDDTHKVEDFQYGWAVSE